MKKIILILLFSTVMFSSSSYAGWTEVDESDSGEVMTTIYVDFERIRKVDGYVYFWELFDYLKPTSQGHLSAKVYLQGDCKLFRYEYLSGSFHNQPMGGGTGDTENFPEGWNYPPPNSSIETVLKQVCNR
jgi:hypothetical protein